MKVVSRMFAGVLLTVSLTGCCGMHNCCDPCGGYYGGGYQGSVVPAEWNAPVGAACGVQGCNAGPACGTGCCQAPVDPCCPTGTGCCILDGFAHILDSLHLGCGYECSNCCVGDPCMMPEPCCGNGGWMPHNPGFMSPPPVGIPSTVPTTQYVPSYLQQSAALVPAF